MSRAEHGCGGPAQPTCLNIDWKINNFREVHRQSDAIKSPGLTSHGAVWHIALAAGTDAARSHVALYLRYKVDPNNPLLASSRMQLKFRLTIGSDISQMRLQREGHTDTQMDDTFRSTFTVKECVEFHPIDEFWESVDLLCDPNGDLKVRADIQIMPHPADLITSIGRSSTKGEEASKSPAVVSAERSAKATPSSSSKRVRSVLIEKGTTVAVKGVSEQSASGTEWWLGKLEADLLSDHQPRDSITVRWWNRKRANAWKLDPPEQKSVVMVATMHRDGSMFEMERIGKSNLFRVVDEGAFDRLQQTYGL